MRTGPGRIFVAAFNRFDELGARRPVVVAVLFALIYVPFLFFNGLKYFGNSSQDLRSFYGAARLVFVHGLSPYNPRVLGHVVGSLGNHRFFPYVYPPWSTLFFYPLAKLSYAQTCDAVLIINNLLYLALLWIVPVLLLGFHPKKRPAAFIIAVFLMVIFDPTRWSLYLGQVDILVLTSIVLFWISSRSGKVFYASLFLAFAVFVKTYPVILIPFLFLAGRRRECVRAFVWLGLAVIVSYLVLPQMLWHDWFTRVFPLGGYFRTPPGLYPPADIRNESLNGFLARLLKVGGGLNAGAGGLVLARSAAYVTIALFVGITGLAVWRGRKLGDSLDRAMIVTLPLIFIIVPFSYRQHMLYLLPAILFLIFSNGRPGKKRNMLFYSLLAATALAITLPRTLALDFYSVFMLWCLAIFALLSGKFEFVNGRTDERRIGGKATEGTSAAVS